MSNKTNTALEMPTRPNSFDYDALIDCAHELGLSHLDATVFAENRRVAGLLRSSGLALDSRIHDGLRNLSLSLDSRPS